jgi:phosphoserine phosphatase RsbX
MTEGDRLSIVEYGVDSVGMQGETESGDSHIVKEISTGVLISVIDGLGHGVEAAAASQAAVKTIESCAEESIINIARACDEELKKTRGAVMALASVNSYDHTLTWLSIGSVEGMLIRMNPKATPGYENIFMRPGVVGYHILPLFASVFTISRDDLLIFSTDGIRNDYSQKIASDLRYAQDVLHRLKKSQIKNLSKGIPHEEPAVAAHEFALTNNIDLSFVARGKESYAPQNLASYICRNYAKGSDDALVLVAKYLGKT